MTVELGYLVIIQIFVLIVMAIMVMKNTMLERKQQKVFIATFSIIAIISIFEYLTQLIEGKNANLRLVNYFITYIGFALTPFVPLCFAFAVDNDCNIKIPVLILAIYPLFLLLSLPFGLVFEIDEHNVYSRGPLYFIYIIAYLASIGYLLVVSIKMVQKFQKNNISVLILNFIFLILGTTIQIIEPTARVTWICVTALSIVYYEYCNNLWHQIDGLTRLLSQESFIASTKKLNNDGILVLFDIDNFKEINDNYGHSTGDEYLKNFAKNLLQVYHNIGYCYRIGGDEFAVIVPMGTEIKKFNKQFEVAIEEYNKNFETNLSVSYGIREFKKGENILSVKDSADEMMYSYKHRHKEEN